MSELQDGLSELGQAVVNRMRRELGATKKRKNYRAQWSKGNLKSYKVTFSNRRIDPNGKLGESLDYKVKKAKNGFILIFEAVDYAIYVDEGRKPGKGAPVGVLENWIKDKNIRLQKITRDKSGNLKSQGFLPKTDKNIRSASFLMNRKIRTFGIEPWNFIDPSIEDVSKQVDELGGFYAEDIAEMLRKKYS